LEEKDIRDRKIFDKYLQILEEDTKKIFDDKKFVEVPCPACGSL